MLILIGKGGTGKSTIEKMCVEMGLKKVVSCTTRPKRDNETADVDYHFLTEAEFDLLFDNNEFLETTEFNGWRYGALKAEVFPDSVLVVEWNGLKQILANDEYKNDLQIVHVASSNEDIIDRMLKRNVDPNLEEIRRRIGSDVMEWEKHYVGREDGWFDMGMREFTNNAYTFKMLQDNFVFFILDNFSSYFSVEKLRFNAL